MQHFKPFHSNDLNSNHNIQNMPTTCHTKKSSKTSLLVQAIDSSRVFDAWRSNICNFALSNVYLDGQLVRQCWPPVSSVERVY